MKHTFYFGFMQELLAKGAAEAARTAKAFGFDSVEVLEGAGKGYPRIALAEAPAMREAMAAEGVSVACYSVGATLYGSDAVEECLMRHIEVAAALGSPLLHHTLIFSTREAGPSFEEALADLVERAVRIAEYAARFGLTVIYEDQGFYFNGIENFGKFYRAVKSRCANVGVCADFGNILYADEAPVPFIRAYASEIRHVHVKDYLFAEAWAEGWQRTAAGHGLKAGVFGEGVVDIPACLAALREAGYDGALAYEVESKPLMEDTARAREYMKTIL